MNRKKILLVGKRSLVGPAREGVPWTAYSQKPDFTLWVASVLTSHPPTDRTSLGDLSDEFRNTIRRDKLRSAHVKSQSDTIRYNRKHDKSQQRTINHVKHDKFFLLFP
jgi:hypothetical protein